ncbi:unnamed protein product [Bursaphelenchus okinawaensis]|uniref:Uncharacterized protein n=1 Tax=Bursaphelenchus okinawaensis TaxID=465554 RepID=A0A811LDI4_9BILA|nr:unnamed protein product [Bursaphelenchus okinawaensis]CAG9120679.1 unnamed protein product [Bursaphelenchus okinawaensis]
MLRTIRSGDVDWLLDVLANSSGFNLLILNSLTSLSTNLTSLLEVQSWALTELLLTSKTIELFRSSQLNSLESFVL